MAVFMLFTRARTPEAAPGRKGRQSHHVIVYSPFTYDVLVSPPI